MRNILHKEFPGHWQWVCMCVCVFGSVTPANVENTKKFVYDYKSDLRAVKQSRVYQSLHQGLDSSDLFSQWPQVWNDDNRTLLLFFTDFTSFLDENLSQMLWHRNSFKFNYCISVNYNFSLLQAPVRVCRWSRLMVCVCVCAHACEMCLAFRILSNRPLTTVFF